MTCTSTLVLELSQLADSTGIVGIAIVEGQRILFDGTEWAITWSQLGGGVATVTGTAPITIGGDADDVIVVLMKQLKLLMVRPVLHRILLVLVI